MSIEQSSNELTEEFSINRFVHLKRFLKSHQQIIPFILMIIILVLPINLFIIKQLINKFSLNPKTQNPPLVSVEKILNGSLQKEYETWFNNHNPMKSMFTNFNNQFYYSLFSKSLMFDSNIVIGKNAYLFEKIYINQYVNLSKVPYTQRQFDLWAADLQELADFFKKRGQKFIYLITPSKASFYPEYLPDSYAKIIKDTRPDYFLKIEALKKVHVPYFDASQFILANKDKSYGYLLFPQGGTHWTMLGASLVAERILDLISQQTQMQLPPLSYSYTVTTRPLGVDKDLLHLCKLLFPPKHYTVPYVSFKKNENPVSLKVAIIGGSFTHFFKQLFTESHYFSQLDHFYYLILNHYQISKNGKKEPPMNRDDPRSYQDILAADVVILEENEILPYSNHFRELYFRLLGKPPSS